MGSIEYILIDSDSEDEEEQDQDGLLKEDEEEDSTTCSEHQKDYTIVSEDDIRQRQDMDVTTISTTLSVSRVSATIMLKFYNWNLDKLQNEWLVDEEKVRKAVGLVGKAESEVVKTNKRMKVTCNICLESYSLKKMDAAACEHLFCIECWTGYISTAISDGPGCLMMHCPDLTCNAAVCQNMINRIVSDEDRKKYEHYLIRSYIDGSRTSKWCPAPGCDYAVDFEVGSEICDVNCKCGNSFCWSCTEDAHRPLDCGMVKKWIARNSDESENTNWILQNSKPCPKCKKPIEKNTGCMHMTCPPPCRFHFCWLCLGDWSEHGQKTGGFYTCNGYQEKEGYIENKKVQEWAKQDAERYLHYFKRWAANHESRKKALADFKQMEAKEFEKIIEKQDMTIQSDLKIIREAWLTILEGQRVLKWSYTYGYYLPEQQTTEKQERRAEKALFEHLQGQAESALERLHNCTEEELKVFFEVKRMPQEFHKFKLKLEALVKASHNLIKALVNNLSEINSLGASSKVESSKQEEVEEQQAIEGEEDTHWSCVRCTFVNLRSVIDCEICRLPRNGGL